MMANLLVLIALTLTYLQLSSCYIPRFMNGRPRGGMLGSPARNNKIETDAPPPEMWMTQRLTHFDDANTKTWQQRYFVNDKYYKHGGPAFLQIGGEGKADSIWMVEGAWVDYAKNHGAIMFMVEHRFYGKSHPMPDMSDASLEYLSSEQSLADMAYFIQFAKSKYNLSHAKWIAFGGSYSGALAAWLRMKYPHLISGAVATSAPVQALFNFKEYMGVVRDSLATTGPQCNKFIQEAVTTVTQLLQDKVGRAELRDMFSLCDDIDINNKNDIANLFETLSGNFAGVVQYNKDNRKFEGALGTNITLDVLCDIMTDHSITVPIVRYSKVNGILLQTYKQTCVDFVYSKMVDDLKKTDWNSSAAEGGRQWTYQTCTEFAYFQTSDLSDQPFGHKFPVGFSVQQCMDIFESKFNGDFIQKAVNNTNTNYGGLGIQVTKTVFPNGSIDPWHALGILKDLNPEATAIYIKGTAHCANMYPAQDSDPTQLTQARKTINTLIGKWIQ